MSSFFQLVNNFSQLDEAATDDLSNHLQNKIFNKGDHLLKRGGICHNLYFIDEGLTKTYFHNKEKEFIMRFFTENSMFTVLDSFITQTPSTYAVMALEQTTVTYISKTNLESL